MNPTISSIKLQNYKCFKDVEIRCHKGDGKTSQWTILLGSNNTGKTNILRAIALVRPIYAPPLKELGVEGFLPAAWSKENTRTSFKKPKSDIRITVTLSNEKQWQVEYRNTGTPKYSVTSKSHIVLGYGVSRYPDQSSSLSIGSSEPCESLFSINSRLINFEEWLLQLDYASKKLDYASKSNQPVAEKRLNKIKEVLCGGIFPDITDFKFSTTSELENIVEFKVQDGWFRYTDLGFGYQSTLSWVVDLCHKLFEAYPDADNPLEGQAIVLVDEIDLHLHPKWQREVTAYLSKSFPNVQFIATTHSPLVIQSMEEVNLYVLKRISEDEVSVEHSPISDFRGWTVEEILRETMGLEDDIYSDFYNQQREAFEEALDAEDKEQAKQAYEKLLRILHPNNPARRMLELQFKTM